MAIEKTIKFTSSVQVEDYKGDIKFEAAEGDIKTLVETSANRWIRRGKAVEVSDEDKKTRTRRATSKPTETVKDDDSDKD